MSLLSILALAFANTVEMDGARWTALQPPDEAKEEGPGPRVLSRTVQLDPQEEEVRFEARWDLWSGEKGWFEARIAGPGVHLAEASYRGRDLAITEDESGVHVAIEVDGKGELFVRGVAVGDARRGPVTLDLMPAAVGRVRVDTEAEPVVTARGAVVQLRDGIWSSAPGLALQITDPTPAAPRPDLAMATAALGLTVGEGEWSARGRVRWEVRHGELSSVVLRGSGLGSDLDVTGASVASWRRSGDRIEVTLLEPEDRLVELELSWTGAVPEGDEAKLALPTLRPEGAFRTESSVQLARDGELEVVPELTRWTPVPFSDLPEWGRGLVLGTPTATFAATGSPEGQVGLFRFTPVSGPPTFVDVATITAAATADGAVLMRAHYAVRNDRSAHLRVSPPEGARVVGARVAGETARVARDGTTWLVPLEKSVETVEGLLSFPVEVILLVPGPSWDRRESRALPLPTVDAPVAVTRATLHLPPGYASRLEDGDGEVVGAFSEGEGIAYGKATGSSAEAEALMQEAVQAWMGNSFEDAQQALKQLEDIGGFDENARRLQSNLDVISGKGEGQYDVALERRVKEQAKARSLDDQVEQERALEEAEQSYLSGDYESAEVGYRKALKLGEKLDKLEQKESVELEVANSMVQSQLDRSRQEAEVKKEKAKELVAKLPAPARQAPVEIDKTSASVTLDGEVLDSEVLHSIPAGRTYSTVLEKVAGVSGGKSAKNGRGNKDAISGGSANENTYLFDGVEVSGELVVPEGSHSANLVVVRDQKIVLRDPSAAAAGPPAQDVPILAPMSPGDVDGDALFGADGTVRGEVGQVGLGVVGGEVGGVEGGVVGGVLGGAMGGVVTGSSSAMGWTESEADEPAPEPEALGGDDDYWADGASVDVVMTTESKRAVRLPKVSVGSKKKPMAAPAVTSPPPPAPPAEDRRPLSKPDRGKLAFKNNEATGSVDEDRRDAGRPAVTAVQLTAVIPTQGESVRYERLLLEAGAHHELEIDATLRRRDR